MLKTSCVSQRWISTDLRSICTSLIIFQLWNYPMPLMDLIWGGLTQMTRSKTVSGTNLFWMALDNRLRVKMQLWCLLLRMANSFYICSEVLPWQQGSLILKCIKSIPTSRPGPRSTMTDRLCKHLDRDQSTEKILIRRISIYFSSQDKFLYKESTLVSKFVHRTCINSNHRLCAGSVLKANHKTKLSFVVAKTSRCPIVMTKFSWQEAWTTDKTYCLSSESCFQSREAGLSCVKLAIKIKINSLLEPDRIWLTKEQRLVITVSAQSTSCRLWRSQTQAQMRCLLTKLSQQIDLWLTCGDRPLVHLQLIFQAQMASQGRDSWEGAITLYAHCQVRKKSSEMAIRWTTTFLTSLEASFKRLMAGSAPRMTSSKLCLKMSF